MFLRRLAIENIRSIERLELSFATDDPSNRKWTILLGENGTGKSTILRAIALLLAGSDTLTALLRTPQLWIRYGAKSAHIEADICTADGEQRQVRLDLRANDSSSSVVKRNDENLKLLDAALRHAGRNYFLAGYGASRRLPGEEAPKFGNAESFSLPRARAVASLFSRDATLRPLDAWAMDVHYRRQDEGLKLIRSTMDELLPGVTFKEIDRENRELLFNTPDGVVPLQQLSDGYQNMAAWVGDLLFRITDTFHNYRQPLTARGLLLLDEIDLHLHPIWQRQVLNFLDSKLPNFQIIATTHSPFTAQQAPPRALHIVERLQQPGSKNPAVLRARQYSGDPKLLRVEQLLEPLLGLPTSESFAAQKVREKQRELKNKATLTPREKRDLKEFTDAVRVLPQAQAIEPAEQARLELLARIDKHLSGNGVSSPATELPAKSPAVAAPPAGAIQAAFVKLRVSPAGKVHSPTAKPPASPSKSPKKASRKK